MLAKLPPGSAPDRPASGGVTAASTPKSPAEIVATCAADRGLGRYQAARMSYFTPANFPNEKQDDTVREAYIELRLRQPAGAWRRRSSARARRQESPTWKPRTTACPSPPAGLRDIIRGARFQYLLGVVEFACGNEAAGARSDGRGCPRRMPASRPRTMPIPILALAQTGAGCRQGAIADGAGLPGEAGECGHGGPSGRAAVQPGTAAQRDRQAGRSDVEFPSPARRRALPGWWSI